VAAVDRALGVTLFVPDGIDPAPWVDALRAVLPASVNVHPWSPGASPADYAVVWAPPQQLIDEQTRLKAIFTLGAGVDALMKLRLPESLPVVRLDDAGMGTQMAQTVCHAVIRHVREFDAFDAQQREGRWQRRRPRDARDFAVALLGLGVLGQRVAQALRALGFTVHGWSRTPKKAASAGGVAQALEGVTCHHGLEGLHTLLPLCRVLVNLLPLTPDTRDLLNRDTLSRLARGGYVINVARGEHLVDDDLLALLDSGHLDGAMLDVFRTEPLPADHPFWKHPRITVTPHTAAQTLRREATENIAAKIVAMERGETVAGRVDRLRGY
jgi:glyoxylate/hydroxypyruvate reductase